MSLRVACIIAAIATTGACSLVTVQQDPFPPLQITGDRAPPPPARVVLTDSSIQILDKVQFESGKSEVLPVSFPLLDQVAAVLVDNPQIKKLQVEGHTDDVGGNAFNKKLSQSRAEAVRKYLIDKGVAKGRLVAKGFGEEKPLSDNTTVEGREINRRVEFNILEQGPKETLVQDE